MAYTQGTSNQLTKKLWDSLLHKAVQNKLFFKDMIGKDKGGEDNQDSTVSNYPIVEKTQLNKDSGDTITMGLLKNLYQGSATGTYNQGRTGTETLVDQEQGLTFHNVAARVAHLRDGVLIQGKLTEQRSPYDLKKEAKDRLSVSLAKQLDDGLFPTIYMGYSPNVVRELGTTVAARTAHPNIIYGQNQNSLLNVGPADVLNTNMLENVSTWVNENNINPVIIDGKETFLYVTNPRGTATLRKDSNWIDANRMAMERGDKNPIFSRAMGRWANIFVMETNKISSAKTWATCTVTGAGTGADPHILSVSDDTVGSGLAATDIYMNVVMGANSVARAFALESYMVKRKEDDYENNIGFGGGYIYGDRRADWALAQDSGSDGTIKNQSSAVVYVYSPNPNSNAVSVW